MVLVKNEQKWLDKQCYSLKTIKKNEMNIIYWLKANKQDKMCFGVDQKRWEGIGETLRSSQRRKKVNWAMVSIETKQKA